MRATVADVLSALDDAHAVLARYLEAARGDDHSKALLAGARLLDARAALVGRPRPAHLQRRMK